MSTPYEIEPYEVDVKLMDVKLMAEIVAYVLRAKYGRTATVKEAERYTEMVASTIRQKIDDEVRRLEMACTPIRRHISAYEMGDRGLHLSEENRSRAIRNLNAQIAGAQIVIDWLLAVEVGVVWTAVCSGWYCDRARVSVSVGGRTVGSIEAILSWRPGLVALVLGSALMLLTLLIGA